MILGLEPVTLLKPLLGHALVVSGSFDAFVRELAVSVNVSSLVSGTGTPSVSTWSDPSFDFTGLTPATGLTLVVGTSTYPIVSLAAGSVTVTGVIAETAGPYRVSGTVLALLEGGRVSINALNFARTTGQLVVASGVNAGTYDVVSGSLGYLVASGVLLSVAYSTGLTSQVRIHADQTQGDVAAALVASAVAAAELFARPYDSNAFVVWGVTQPVPTVTISGPKAASVTTTETSRGTYLQDDFGRAIPIQWASSTILAGLQPIGRERTKIQEIFGQVAQFKGYTNEVLPMTDHTTQDPGCLIEADGQRFRVIGEERRRSLLIHTKFYLVRETEQ